eukprot:15446865-Alexandrium_andersonii.AAC.1
MHAVQKYACFARTRALDDIWHSIKGGDDDIEDFFRLQRDSETMCSEMVADYRKNHPERDGRARGKYNLMAYKGRIETSTGVLKDN